MEKIISDAFMKKIKTEAIIKIYFFSAIIIIIAGLASTSLFLYKNFYQTIIHSQKIKILKNEILVERIDMDLYDKVIENLDKKKEISMENLSALKNPFESIEE